MEYLLREKLEKLVQSEIESRLAAYQRDGVALGGGAAAAGGDAGGAAAYASMVAASSRQLQGDLAARTEELAASRAQCSALEDEVRALRRRAQQQPLGGSDASVAVSAAVAEAVSAAAASAAAEGRDAASVQQLRDRLSVHVKERRAIHTIMEQKIKALVDSIAGATAGAPAPALLRDVQALQRLVNASITAMRNSEHEQQQDGGAAGAPAASASSGFGAAGPAQPPMATPTPLGRSAAPPPQIPAIGAASLSMSSSSSAASGFSAATTPASIDAMIQRRKDELARMRGGAGLQAGEMLQVGPRPPSASAVRGRPG